MWLLPNLFIGLETSHETTHKIRRNLAISKKIEEKRLQTYMPQLRTEIKKCSGLSTPKFYVPNYAIFWSPANNLFVTMVASAVHADGVQFYISFYLLTWVINIMLLHRRNKNGVQNIGRKNEEKSQLGKSKYRMEDNIKMVLGDMWYQTVGSLNLYQKSCVWWLWSSKPTFICHLSLELNLLAITNFQKMSVISGLSMIHSATIIISLECMGKAIAKHRTVACRGKYSAFIHIPLRQQHLFSCWVHANATVTS